MNKPCKVLAVDDNLANRLLITKILTEIGIEVVTVNNGLEAVTMAAKESYDLILMDIQMPVMNGFEATRLIRAGNYKNPILALSANIKEENFLKFKEIGMNDFHQKPFHRTQLIGYVEKWI